MIDEPEDFDDVTEPEPVSDPAPKRRQSRAKAAESDLTAYRVVKAAIAPNGGARSDVIRPGEVAHLTKEQAKHYNALGFLAPVIED